MNSNLQAILSRDKAECNVTIDNGLWLDSGPGTHLDTVQKLQAYIKAVEKLAAFVTQAPHTPECYANVVSGAQHNCSCKTVLTAVTALLSGKEGE